MICKIIVILCRVNIILIIRRIDLVLKYFNILASVFHFLHGLLCWISTISRKFCGKPAYKKQDCCQQARSHGGGVGIKRQCLPQFLLAPQILCLEDIVLKTYNRNKGLAP